MKKALCFILSLLLLLALAACGRKPAPTAEPTGTPAVETREPEPSPVPTDEPISSTEPQDPQDPLERALAYLRQRDRDWNYVSAHLGTYQELYKLTHPGADVQIIGGGIGAKEVSVEVAGEDAQAFAEAGIFSDRITVHTVKRGDPCFPQDLPISREPETDRVSERGMRITMDRAVWPVGAEYLSFTIGNETDDSLDYGAKRRLEKYADGSWQSYSFPGMVLAIGYSVSPHTSHSYLFPLTDCVPLGEGLYRVGIVYSGGWDWAEFVVRSDAEPLDLTPVTYGSWPEAALLLAGLPEGVESGLQVSTQWPAVSHTWRLEEDCSLSDAELAELLLGTEAEYDPETEVWRLGNRTLDLKDGARLTAEDPLVRALSLLVPAQGTDNLDPRSIPTLAEAGWIYDVPFDGRDASFLSLFDSRREEIEITDQAGILRTAELAIGGGCKAYAPDCAILTARLEELLAEKRVQLGEEAFLAEYGDLAGFSFRPEDLAQLCLVQAPIRARLGRNAIDYTYVSPWGQLDGAVWLLYDRESQEILALSARYLGYRLVPEDAWETRSPLEQVLKFLPLMEGEEELRLTRMDYVLIPGQKEGTLMPAWRMLAETASGEIRTWVASTRNDRQSAYDLQRRVYLEELMSAHTVIALFETCWEQYPEMDVWPVSWGINRLEDGQEYLLVECDGVDCPALETSGLLPDGVTLRYPEEQFNQKLSHPCPREPEWEKSWAGGTVTLTMAQAEYPLYPDYVELTVRCERSFNRNWDRFEKYADGEWHHVREWMAGNLGLRYVESGETVLQVRTNAKLGPGLYRLYLNDEYWVEFKITDRTAEN